jgi:hypothetical protein
VPVGPVLYGEIGDLGGPAQGSAVAVGDRQIDRVGLVGINGIQARGVVARLGGRGVGERAVTGHHGLALGGGHRARVAQWVAVGVGRSAWRR